jgi:type II secretory pathway pseudopilin PulG
MFFIAVIGIIAAIAIPQFVTYRNRAYQHAVISELTNFRAAQEAYFGEYNRYARNINNLKFTAANPEVTIEIMSADRECFEAKGTHKKIDQPVLIDCNSIRNRGR